MEIAIQLIADFIGDMFGRIDTGFHGRQTYPVQWRRFTNRAKPNTVFQIKARSRDQAFKKAYKKLFTREDRREFLDLVGMGDVKYVQVRNTNQSGWFVGILEIVEK